MKPFSPQQKAVFDKALQELQKKEWFRGVCTDDFPNDLEIQEDFEGAVTRVVMNTAYYDAPDFFNP